MLFQALGGALAGTIATFPMTAAMEAVHATRPRGHQRPLPPEKVVHGILHRASGGREMNRDARIGWTLAAHLGYGVAAGALYGAAVGRTGNCGKGAIKGAAFGLGVWAGSYAGWLPLAGVLPPAWRQPAGENAELVVSHVVWGALTGVMTELLISRS